MKLNFELCKKCRNVWSKSFSNNRTSKHFYFFCHRCGYFEFNVKKYKCKKFNDLIYIEEVTKQEWTDINQMEIIECKMEDFNKCHYYFEHLVEN